VDDFDRGDAPLGGNWSGAAVGYSIVANQLDVGTGEDIYWNVSSFSADQEVYVTLSAIDPGTNEIGVVLKSQSSSSLSPGLIEVVYDAAKGQARVWTYADSQGWVRRGGTIQVTFIAGDQFGARATADGTITIYRNGTVLATREVTGWPYYANGGFIGLRCIRASNTILDDFGGGTAGSFYPLGSAPLALGTTPMDTRLLSASRSGRLPPLGNAPRLE
jgi:hypothetical protein